jgi:hypothetical protein
MSARARRNRGTVAVCSSLKLKHMRAILVEPHRTTATPFYSSESLVARSRNVSYGTHRLYSPLSHYSAKRLRKPSRTHLSTTSVTPAVPPFFVRPRTSGTRIRAIVFAHLKPIDGFFVQRSACLGTNIA